MKKSVILISIISFLVLVYSCSISRNAEINGQGSTQNTEAQSERENEVEFYVCQGDTIVVKDYLPGSNKSWQYHSIMTCLNETGRYGDVEANREIAKIITKTGYEGLRFFRSEFPTSRLRGKDIFEATLNLGINDKPVTTYDGDKSLRTLTSVVVRNLIAMIETIDGYKEVYRYAYMKNSDFDEGMTDIDNVNIARDQMHYYTIKQAWEDGLIVLKPYYNK